MSAIFRLEKVGGHFELLRTAYPEFRAEVDLSKPYPRLGKIRLIGRKPGRRELSKSKKEATEYLGFLVLMRE